MNAVPWEIFCAYPDGHAKFADGWLLVPGNVVSTFRDGTQYCRLCDGFFIGTPAIHVAGHEPELCARRESQRRNDRKVDIGDMKLVEALMLVDNGMSQRKAAEAAGVPRTTLQEALARRAGSAQEVAGVRTQASSRLGSRPPQSGVAPRA